MIVATREGLEKVGGLSAYPDAIVAGARRQFSVTLDGEDVTCSCYFADDEAGVIHRYALDAPCEHGKTPQIKIVRNLMGLGHTVSEVLHGKVVITEGKREQST